MLSNNTPNPNYSQEVNQLGKQFGYNLRITGRRNSDIGAASQYPQHGANDDLDEYSNSDLDGENDDMDDMDNDGPVEPTGPAQNPDDQSDYEYQVSDDEDEGTINTVVPTNVKKNYAKYERRYQILMHVLKNRPLGSGAYPQYSFHSAILYKFNTSRARWVPKGPVLVALEAVEETFRIYNLFGRFELALNMKAWEFFDLLHRPTTTRLQKHPTEPYLPDANGNHRRTAVFSSGQHAFRQTVNFEYINSTIEQELPPLDPSLYLPKAFEMAVNARSNPELMNQPIHRIAYEYDIANEHQIMALKFFTVDAFRQFYEVVKQASDLFRQKGYERRLASFTKGVTAHVPDGTHQNPNWKPEVFDWKLPADCIMTRVLARNGFEYYPYYEIEGGSYKIQDQTARCTYCDSRLTNIQIQGTAAEPAARTRSDTVKEEESVLRQLVVEHMKLSEQRGHYCVFCHPNALSVWDGYHN